MAMRDSGRLVNALLLVVAVALALGIAASGIPPSRMRNALLAIDPGAWCLFVGSYPFVVLRSGVVTGIEPVSRSHRAYSPARFRVGFVATTLFWLAVLGVVSPDSAMAWYRGT